MNRMKTGPLSGALAILSLLAMARSDSNECENLNLFASRTAYSEALGACLWKDSDFFSRHSLRDVNDMLCNQGCMAHSFYLLGRHAARHPSKEEMTDMNEGIEKIKELLRSKGDDRYLAWVSPFDEHKCDLITRYGALNHEAMAQRYKAIYGELFDASKTNVELANTSKFRTAQSAIEFAKAVDNFRLFAEIPEERIEPSTFDSERVDTDKEILKVVLNRYKMKELEYHKVCKIEIKKEIRGRVTSKAPKSEMSEIVSGIKKKVLATLAQKIGQKLRLKSDVVPADVVQSVYDACRFETNALPGGKRSIWCDLFDQQDLEALEYLEDANIFHKMSSARDSFTIQSAPLFSVILGKLNKSVREKHRQTFFGFTHDGIMKKIFTALGFFDDDQGYTQDDLRRFEQTGVAPTKRKWQASLMVPFSAHVGFVLYWCPEDGGSFKVLTTVSERPVRIDGCQEPVCKLETIMKNYGWLTEVSHDQVTKEVETSMGLH